MMKQGAWDVGLIDTKPQRAKALIFLPGCLEIESTYLVSTGSPIRGMTEVDRGEVRVAVLAYQLYLSRSLQRAQLVLEKGLTTFQHFVTDTLNVLAGLRPQLATDAEKLSGGGRSLARTLLCRKFRANREKYRENLHF